MTTMYMEEVLDCAMHLSMNAKSIDTHSHHVVDGDDKHLALGGGAELTRNTPRSVAESWHASRSIA